MHNAGRTRRRDPTLYFFFFVVVVIFPQGVGLSQPNQDGGAGHLSGPG